MSAIHRAVLVATLVASQCTDVEDIEVEGRYEVKFDPPVDRSSAAALALNEFHETVPVGTLDDFEFRVENLDGEILEEPEDTVPPDAASSVSITRLD